MSQTNSLRRWAGIALVCLVAAPAATAFFFNPKVTARHHRSG